MAATPVGIRPSTVPSPIPVIPTSVFIFTKMVRSELTEINLAATRKFRSPVGRNDRIEDAPQNASEPIFTEYLGLEIALEDEPRHDGPQRRQR